MLHRWSHQYHQSIILHITNRFLFTLEGIMIPDGFEIISLDFASLFTNVPEYLICSAIEKR